MEIAQSCSDNGDPTVLTKEDHSVDFAMSISGTLDKLSWLEKCEEVCHIQLLTCVVSYFYPLEQY